MSRRQIRAVRDDYLFVDEFEDLIAEEPTLKPPTYRATIRRGRLTLTGWAPFLVTSGPMAQLFPSRERAGITIADLTIDNEGEEVLVRYWAIADNEEADEVLCQWATDAGYRRLWLPDAIVVELDREPERIDAASVRCPTCRAEWSDATPEFWSTVRSSGAFPRWCPICGCEMPQWTVHPSEPRRTSSPGHRDERIKTGFAKRTADRSDS